MIRFLIEIRVSASTCSMKALTRQAPDPMHQTHSEQLSRSLSKGPNLTHPQFCHSGLPPTPVESKRSTRTFLFQGTPPAISSKTRHTNSPSELAPNRPMSPKARPTILPHPRHAHTHRMPMPRISIDTILQHHPNMRSQDPMCSCSPIAIPIPQRQQSRVLQHENIYSLHHPTTIEPLRIRHENGCTSPGPNPPTCSPYRDCTHHTHEK